MKFLSISTLFLCLSLQVFSQGPKKLIENARNAMSNGDFDKAVELIYKASSKKGDNKHVIAGCNSLIPAIFEAKENKIRDLNSKINNSDNADKQYQLEGQVIEEYEDLIKYASKLKYCPSSSYFKGHAQAFTSKDYNPSKEEAITKRSAFKDSAKEKYYQEGKRLMAQGEDRYAEAMKAFNRLEALDSDYKDARQSMAEMYYAKGKTAMNAGNREAYKQAYHYFKSANGYVLDFKDAKEQQLVAKDKATLRVAVFPFTNASGVERVGAIGNIQSDEIVRSIYDSDFVDVVSRDEVDALIMREQALATSGYIDEETASKLGKKLGVNQIITGKINQIVMNPPQTVRTTSKEAQKVYVNAKGDVVTDAEGGLDKITSFFDKDKKSTTRQVEKYATVTKYEKRASAKVVCSYQLTEIETGRIVKSNAFTEDFEFQHEWATFSGSKHGLSKETETLTKSSDVVAPSGQEMVNKCASQSAKRIAKELDEFLR